MSGGAFVAYRDRLAPRSELTFLSRQYVAFERLKPLWLGRKRDVGFDQLGGEARLLGGGWIEREAYKFLGRLPGEPDLRALRPKLVHAHFGRGGALALPMARALGVPLVVSFYGADATKERQYQAFPPSIFRMRLKALQREAALFLCVSDFVRRRLVERGFPEGKLRTQHSGVNIEPEWGWTGANEAPYVLFAARFVEKKGAFTLIEAVRRLQGEGRNLRLVMVGEGPLEGELRRAAAGLAAVEFRGWMGNAELRGWLRGALALCAPSQRGSDGDEEGLPTIALEALSAGTPVVGSAVAGIGEAVVDGRNGFLTPEKDADAVAAALRKLIDSSSLRMSLGQAARETAVTSFSMEGQSRRLEEILLGLSSP
jgi:glycosyltransferase involved in cell wall biosynthesis